MPDLVIKPRRGYFFSLKQAEQIADDVLDPKTLLLPIKSSVTIKLKSEPSVRLKKTVEKAVEDYLDRKSEQVCGVLTSCVKGFSTPAEKAEAANVTISAKAKVLDLEIEMIVKRELEKEAKQDQLLKEAKVVVVFKATTGVVKVAKDAVTLVGTAGADVSAWISIGSNAYDLINLVLNHFKSEQKLQEELQKARKELEEALADLNAAREQAKAANGLSAFFANIKKLKAWHDWTKAAESTEGGRQAYRNSVYRIRSEIEKVEPPLKKLTAEVKAAKTLKEGVKLGAQLMNVKRAHRLAMESYDRKLKALDELNTALKELGADVDDDTWSDKYNKFKAAIQSKQFKEVAGYAKESAGAISEMKDAAEAVVDLIKALAS